MAIEWINWAVEQNTGSATNKAVLMAVCNYANKKGECWPSQKCIKTFTELSVRSIQRALTSLEEKGFISREPRRRKDGYRGTDLYKLNKVLGDTQSGDRVSCDTQSGDRVPILGDTQSQSQATECQGYKYLIEPPLLTIIEPPLYTFEDFWTAWKNYKTGKGSKQDAKKAYAKALKKTTCEKLMESSKEYCKFCLDTDCNTKNVFRWLNKNGWEDDYTTPKQTNGANNNGKTRKQRLDEATQRGIAKSMAAEGFTDRGAVEPMLLNVQRVREITRGG